MVEIVNSDNHTEKKAPHHIEPPPLRSRVWWVIRHITASSLWLYATLKLFVFDIDTLLVTNFFPGLAWLVTFKVILYLVFFALILLLAKRAWLLKNISYIALYPFLLAFWYLPFFIIQQGSWILGLAFINALITFFRSFRLAIISLAIYVASFAIILSLSSRPFIWTAIWALYILALVIYFRFFLSVFRPAGIFQVYKKVFSWMRENGKSMYALSDEIKKLPAESFSIDQKTKYTTSLQWAVLYNRLALYLAKKLRAYQSSRINYVGYVVAILLLILLTTITFAGINFALYKINPEAFSLIRTPSFFTFTYYSFSAFHFSSISEISPSTSLAQLFFSTEGLLALVMGGILITLWLTLKGDKYTEELGTVILGIEAEGSQMESFIQGEYQLGISEALERLQEFKAGFIGFLYSLTKGIS